MRPAERQARKGVAQVFLPGRSHILEFLRFAGFAMLDVSPFRRLRVSAGARLEAAVQRVEPRVMFGDSLNRLPGALLDNNDVLPAVTVTKDAAAEDDTFVDRIERYVDGGLDATFGIGGQRQSQTGRSTRVEDPYDLFEGGPEGAGQVRARRAVRSAELKALHSLGLDESATPDQVKSQYKTLVKRLHPDANGGSRANEDKLREIIQAYGRLRETGFC